MTNPFDDDAGEYVVLVNDEGQYSLWPAPIEIPAGWVLAHPKAARVTCLNWIDATWTDIRPKSATRA